MRQGNLGKLCPTVGPHGPWVTSSPSPTPALDGRTSVEGEFTAGLSGAEGELVTIASFRRRCRHDSLVFVAVPSAALFLRPPLVFQVRTLTDPRV